METITATLDEIFAEDYLNEDFQKASRKRKPYNDLISDIVNRRIELKLTQKELANRAKTFQSRISKIESGEHDLRLSTIIKIAEALETSVSISLNPIQTYTQRQEQSVSIKLGERISRPDYPPVIRRDTEFDVGWVTDSTPSDIDIPALDKPDSVEDSYSLLISAPVGA